MNRHSAHIVWLTLAFIGCSDFGSEPSPTYYQDEIREAFFRHQFNHNYSGTQQSAAFYALAFADLVWLPSHPPSPSLRNYRDLSDQFILRFTHNAPPVINRSECIVGPNMLGEIGVWDISRTDRGLLFMVSNIEIVNDTQVRVWGGYYEGGASFSVEIYFMSGARDYWVVDSTSLLIIG